MKYKLIPITEGCEKGLYRIQALRIVDNMYITVNQGDLGGIVQSKLNLSQTGNCWIDTNSKVVDFAQVRNNATVMNYSCMRDHALLKGESILDRSSMHGLSRAEDCCRIVNTKMFGDSKVDGMSNIIDCRLDNDTIIDGCDFYGLDLLGGYHSFPPIRVMGTLYILQWSGIPGKISIGCMTKSISWWRKHKERICTQYKMREEEIEEYQQLFNIVVKWMRTYNVYELSNKKVERHHEN
jgi:hypothetical protein